MDTQLQKSVQPPVVVYYCEKCGVQLTHKIIKEWFDVRTGVKHAIFEFYCRNSGMFNKLFRTHTVLMVDDSGAESHEARHIQRHIRQLM